MIIRPLSRDDAAAAAVCHAASFAKAWDANAIAAHIDKDLALGAFNPDLCGFVILSHAADQAEIITLAVLPALRRAGLARGLVDAAFKALKQRGAAVVFLEVAEDNQAAIGLYRASGFVPMGRRPAYYKRAGGRVAALTYRKNLSG
jgi:ribosomal-protein-alanine N-acetyltransferase